MLILWTVNSKASSSLKVVAPGAFNIVYGDSSGASGDYITDDLTIGGTTVKTLEMGLASQANLSQGLLGIGYATNEASEDSSEAKPFIYPNLITEMVSQSLISAPAYSLYLDDLEASSGSIIFGGMDTDKFIGSLVEIPIVPATLRNGSTLYYEFTVAMTSFSVGSTSLSTTAPVPVLLDSGTSLVYLPTRVTRGLYELLGAYDDTEGTGFVYADCNLLVTNSTGAFDFGFGSNSTSNAAGVTIKVPYSEMLFTQQELGIDLTNYLPPDIPFADVCILGIMAQESQPYILGDTFLRSAYVVYDLKNNVVALAQTNFNSTDSNVVEFTADETAIPKVSGVASQASVTATVTGPVGIGATKSATTTGKGSTSTGSSTSGTSTASSSKSAGVTTVPALDMSLLAVLGGSLALSVLGGGLFLL